MITLRKDDTGAEVIARKRQCAFDMRRRNGRARVRDFSRAPGRMSKRLAFGRAS